MCSTSARTTRRSSNDPKYLGDRHARVRGQRYDDFIDAYVTTAHRLFPHALLHWEDAGADNARALLDRYGEKVSTINDDMQGTAVLGSAAVAVEVAGTAGEEGLAQADTDDLIRRVHEALWQPE